MPNDDDFVLGRSTVGNATMKKLFVLILCIFLSGCGGSNANHKALTMDDESIWNQYHINMNVFSERFIEELTDRNLIFKMKPSISINSRTEYQGSFFYLEITENPKPYEFINKPKQPIDQFSLEVDELEFIVIVSSTTSSPDKDYPWIYITGSNGMLNYYMLLALGSNNYLIRNTYNDSDVFALEDKEKIIEVINSIFSRNSD